MPTTPTAPSDAEPVDLAWLDEARAEWDIW